MNCKFYMQRWMTNKWEAQVDLESRFKGLIVLKVEGLSNKGEIKNIYTEKYAESDKLRVYFPKKVARDSYELTMLLGFTGKDRRKSYDEFVSYIEGHKVKYWDTARNKEVEMFSQKAIEIEEDILIGDVPYIIVPIKFTNIGGSTTSKA